MKDMKRNWEEAEKHLKEVRRQYTDIGIAGMPALQISINPLLVRYENGERTEELYESIIALE